MMQASGGRVIYYADLELAAGATHIIRPDWAVLGESLVLIDMDADGDGTSEQTIELENQGVPVASEASAEHLAPEAPAVRAFPNPASASMTVEVATPEAGDLRVTLHDALGREVAVLHDGPLANGVHAFALDAAPLATGVYVLRAATPEATVTQRATVVQ